MKKTAFLLIAPVLALIVFVSAKQEKIASADDPTIPSNIKTIIDKSCYGCHSDKGKSDDAKEALMWDELANYDKAKQVSVLDEIIEVIDEQKMPPKKFLENYPDKKPTDEEYANLKSWADKQISIVTGG